MSRIRIPALVLMVLSFSIGWSPPDPTELVNPVNMSIKDGRLFVSDRYHGVHVFDVADAAAPAHLYTIPLRGNEGNAVVGDVLYANDYSTLKAFHLGAESYVEVATFARESDPGPAFETRFGNPSRGFGCSCGDYDATGVAAPESGGSSGSSYATFAVVGEYLYYIDGNRLVTVSVADPLEPVKIASVAMGWDVETIYPTEYYLFMGGTRGMYIYERSDPARPREIARVEHVRACDPVVVDGLTAYVTLRGGGRCGGARDVLLTVDIKEPNRPAVICETDVVTPFGLAVDGSLLYVSKGTNGFVLFDVTDREAPAVVSAWTDETKDFIWDDGRLYSMTFEKLNIYDVTDPASPSLLSTLE